MALKYKINTVFLWGMAVFLFLISSLLFYRVEVSKAIINMSIGFFGKQKEFYEINLPFDEICDYVQTYDDQVILTQGITEYSADIEAIFFQHSPFIPMISGRFFKPSDFIVGNYVAVIGKNIDVPPFEQNSMRLIQVGNDEYQVLGVMDSIIPTSFDNKILINGLARNNLTSNHYYNIDFLGENPTIQNDRFQNITRTQYKAAATLKSIDVSFSGSMLLSAFADLYDNRWYVFLAICDFISMLLITIQWLRAKQPQLRALRLCGYSPQTSCNVVIGNYSANMLGACSLGLLIAFCIVPPRFVLLTSACLFIIFTCLVIVIWVSCYFGSVSKDWEKDL